MKNYNKPNLEISVIDTEDIMITSTGITERNEVFGYDDFDEII